MRRWRVGMVLLLALASLAAAPSRSSCAPVGSAHAVACAKRNWITPGSARVSGSALEVDAGRWHAHLDGPSWAPARPGLTDGGSWSSSAAADGALSETAIDGLNVVHLEGPARGVLESVTTVLYLRAATWPATQHLRVALSIDGVTVFRSESVVVRPMMPVLNPVGAVSFVVTGLHDALARRDVANSAATRHIVHIDVGPAGRDGHTYLWGTFDSPSEVSFNLPSKQRPYGTTVLTAK